MDRSIEVTLIEPNSTYYTCPFSNLVVGVVKGMPAIAHHYKTLQSKYEVNFVRARAYQVKSNVVVLEDGTKVPFDLARYTQEWIFAMTKCQVIVKISKKRWRIPVKLNLKRCIWIGSKRRWLMVETSLFVLWRVPTAVLQGPMSEHRWLLIT